MYKQNGVDLTKSQADKEALVKAQLEASIPTQECALCRMIKLKTELKCFDRYDWFLCFPCHAKTTKQQAVCHAMAFK